MKRHVPVQTLIDHIKSAMDVDPWAKEMAEELLRPEPVPIVKKRMKGVDHLIPTCGACGGWLRHGARYCDMCGRKVKRNEP